ncbi:hypothetical protein THAOC_37531, partial [Thalassiosira oceanica]
RDLRRALDLVREERHLAADDLYIQARDRVEEGWADRGRREEKSAKARKNITSFWGRRPNDEANQPDDELKLARDLLDEKSDEFALLRRRASLFLAAKETLSQHDKNDGEESDENTGWVHAQTLFGVSTHYRRESDGSLSIRIAGDLVGVPLFEQLAILREVDLYHAWAPFCVSSRKLAQLGRLDVAAWYDVGVPIFGLSRDACYRAVGCDGMAEDGSVMIVAVGLNDTDEHGVVSSASLGKQTRKRGPSPPAAASDDDDAEGLEATEGSLLSSLARDEILSTLEMPPVPSGAGRGRMTIRNFSAKVDVLGPTSARTIMVVNVDPNLQLIPQALIDFSMKKMCGILLSRLQASARRVLKDPVGNAHARRMREDVTFYRDWLLPKFRAYCEAKGWNMPPVGAFEVSDEELRATGMGWIDDGQSSTADASFIGARTPHSRSSSRAATTDGGFGSGSSSVTSAMSSPMQQMRMKLGLRPAETNEEKIRKARKRAADRLAPRPLSDSSSSRLRRLKDRKAVVEERMRERGGRGGSAGGSIAGGRTIDRLRTTSSPIDADERHEVRRAAGSFLASSALNAVVLTLRRRHSYVLVPLCEPWAPFGLACSLYLGPLLDAISVALQSIALRAALTGLLTFAFDAVDFGQRRFVSNMEEGRKLFVTEARQLSRLAAVFVAYSSLTTASVGWLVKLVCSLERGVPGSVFSEPLFSLSETEVLPEGWNTLLCFAINKLSTTNFAGISHPMRNWPLVEACFKKFQSIFESGCCALASFELGFLTWGANAQAMSAFMALRLVVFVAALVVMGGLVLPKRNDSFETHGRSCDASFEISERDGMSQVPGSLDNSESTRSIMSTINVTRVHGENLSLTMETISEHPRSGQNVTCPS